MKKVLSMFLVFAMMLSLTLVTAVASTAEQDTTSVDAATVTDCINTVEDEVPTAVPLFYGTQETAPEGKKQKIRLIALIDSLRYDEVGFMVTSQVDGGIVKNYGACSVNKAYMILKAGEKIISVEQVNEAYGDPVCKYLCALTFKNVPTTGTVVFTVQTYAKTSTETMTGAKYAVTYQNGSFVSIELMEANIPMSNLAKYVIVKPQKATDATTDLANRLKASVNALEGGGKCAVKTDAIVPGSLLSREQECEILIGETSRAQTATYKETLRSNDYGYTLIDKKIVIFGYNDETLEKAIDLFISQVLSNIALADGVLFAESDAVTKEAEYDISDIMISDASIKNCVIVYPKDDASAKSVAQNLQTFLLDSVDFWVPVQSDEIARQDGVYEILIGETNREEQAPDNLDDHTTYIVSEDNATLIGGADAMGVFHACTLFKRMFVTQESSLKIDIVTPICEDANDELMSVMSFNVYTGDMREERIANVITMIKRYSPSILGVQEANDQWMSVLKADLPEYDYVGVGREKALNGEHSAIFYKKTEFKLLESGTKWLSDTPDEPGSKYDESSYIRIVTWALLERKSDGKKFLAANTHLDWGAQRKQIDVILGLLDDYDCDIILTGDFNMLTSTDNYTHITSQGYSDSLIDAEDFYSIIDREARKEGVIDYCFIKSDAHYVATHRVCDEGVNGTQPSDHDAVYVEMLLP